MYKELLFFSVYTGERKKTQRKQAKYMTKLVHRGGNIWNKYMKRCPNIQVIRKMWIKTMRWHFTLQINFLKCIIGTCISTLEMSIYSKMVKLWYIHVNGLLLCRSENKVDLHAYKHGFKKNKNSEKKWKMMPVI